MKQGKNTKLLRNIALRIKELREQKGITQEDFYNDTGINIGRIERAINNVSITTLDKICNYFDITLKDLSAKFLDEYRRQNYVTPTNFLQLLTNLKKTY